MAAKAFDIQSSRLRVLRSNHLLVVQHGYPGILWPPGERAKDIGVPYVLCARRISVWTRPNVHYSNPRQWANSTGQITIISLSRQLIEEKDALFTDPTSTSARAVSGAEGL